MRDNGFGNSMQSKNPNVKKSAASWALISELVRTKWAILVSRQISTMTASRFRLGSRAMMNSIEISCSGRLRQVQLNFIWFRTIHVPWFPKKIGQHIRIHEMSLSIWKRVSSEGKKNKKENLYALFHVTQVSLSPEYFQSPNNIKCGMKDHEWIDNYRF